MDARAKTFIVNICCSRFLGTSVYVIFILTVRVRGRVNGYFSQSGRYKIGGSFCTNYNHIYVNLMFINYGKFGYTRE